MSAKKKEIFQHTYIHPTVNNEVQSKSRHKSQRGMKLKKNSTVLIYTTCITISTSSLFQTSIHLVNKSNRERERERER